MTGLDTNVLVRYITQDDARQSASAARLMASLSPDQPGFVSLVVLVELLWVLEEAYDTSPERLAELVETLLETASLVVEDAELVWRALQPFRAGKADFSDQLIRQLDAHAGCEVTFTFDKTAARDAGMALLK